MSVFMVGGQTVELELPRRLVVRHDLAVSAATHTGREQTARRVVAAALFLCWPGVSKKQGAPKYTGDVLEYGGEVLDFLLAHKATMDEIIVAGNTALQLVLDSLVTEEGLAKARGNSGEGSGSGDSSGSSGAGTSGPTGS